MPPLVNPRVCQAERIGKDRRAPPPGPVACTDRMQAQSRNSHISIQNLQAIRNPRGFVLSQLAETPGADPLWDFAQQAEHTGTAVETTPEDLNRLRACGLGVADDNVVAIQMNDRFGMHYRRMDMWCGRRNW